MGEGSPELKHEVEGARAALARDVDVLATRTSPHRIAGRTARGAGKALGRVTGRVRDGGRAVRERLRRH